MKKGESKNLCEEVSQTLNDLFNRLISILNQPTKIGFCFGDKKVLLFSPVSLTIPRNFCNNLGSATIFKQRSARSKFAIVNLATPPLGFLSFPIATTRCLLFELTR